MTSLNRLMVHPWAHPYPLSSPSSLWKIWRSMPCTQPHSNPASGWGMLTISLSSGPMENGTCYPSTHTSTRCLPTSNSQLRKRKKGGSHSWMSCWHAAKTSCPLQCTGNRPTRTCTSRTFSPPSKNADRGDVRYASQSPLYLWQHQQATRDETPCQSTWSQWVPWEAGQKDPNQTSETADTWNRRGATEDTPPPLCARSQ